MIKQIGFTIDVNEEEIAPMSVNVWINRWLNGLANEHNISSITVDDVTVPIADKQELYDLSLGEDEDLKPMSSEKLQVKQTKIYADNSR